MEAALASEDAAEVPSPDTVESEETHSGPETPEPETPAALDAPLVKETIVTPGHEEPSVVPNVEEVPIKVPASVVADTTPRKCVPQSCFRHERCDRDAQLLYFLTSFSYTEQNHQTALQVETGSAPALNLAAA